MPSIRFLNPSGVGFAVGLLCLGLLTFACEHNLPSEPANGADGLARAFADPAECAQCHPNHFAEWQASTHAYAFTDPIFFRLNEIGQDRSNQQLDQFCIKCHSPVAMLLGETPPGFDPAAISRLGRQAVQCDVCHRIQSIDRAKGQTDFRLDDTRQGPIVDPVENRYHTSEYDRRYRLSEICTPCHDVLSPDGIQVEFTSREWDNSAYSAMGLECQGCHMPAYRGEAATGGPERTVHRHTFAGADIPLIPFAGREETVQQVDFLMKNAVSMQVSTPQQIAAGDSFDIGVNVLNDRTGHNIPTGTAFERQMWIEVLVTDLSTNLVIFASGELDGNGDLRNHHSEEVKNGVISEDRDLALFHSIAKKDGEEVLFFWEADEIENRTIPPFEARMSQYRLLSPAQQTTLKVNVRLLFRSFAPYFLRAIDMAHLASQVVIFEMAQFQGQIEIN